MKRGLQLLTLAILVFAGCNQISLDESSTIEKGSKQEDLRILPGDASIRWYVGDNASNSLGLFNPVRMIYEITPPTGYFNGL